jgi:hypothetical protein
MHIKSIKGNSIPLQTPNTPSTPTKGKGMLGVTISVPLPLPLHTPHLYPGGIAYPCHSLIELLTTQFKIHMTANFPHYTT